MLLNNYSPAAVSGGGPWKFWRTRRFTGSCSNRHCRFGELNVTVGIVCAEDPLPRPWGCGGAGVLPFSPCPIQWIRPVRPTTSFGV